MGQKKKEKQKVFDVKTARGKDGPITIEAPLGQVRIKVTASPSEWKSLFKQCAKDYKDFAKLGEEFFYNFIFAVNTQGIVKETFQTRGKHKINALFISNLKLESAARYWLFSYMANNFQEQRPEEFDEFVKRELGKEYVCKGKTGKYSPLDLTFYSMERDWGEEAKRRGLDPFRDSENFYKTYILPDYASVSKYIAGGDSNVPLPFFIRLQASEANWPEFFKSEFFKKHSE